MVDSPERADASRVWAALDKARRDLLAERNATGHWVGELASSALSTATAVAALALYERHLPSENSELPTAEQRTKLIVDGLGYLARQQNSDGGWGDTDKSLSNVATTMLVRSAFALTFIRAEQAELLKRADEYLEAHGGVAGIYRRYGRDRTFAAPILATAAMAELVAWRDVPALPFELACCPQGFWKFLRLPVVSYAIPALVAIGQAKFYHARPWNPVTRLIRRWSIRPTLGVLQRSQPQSGGYLEAIPLTSFVVMSLAAIGQASHAVCRQGVSFLASTTRQDGSWPIDINLATWTTTLSLNALAEFAPAVDRGAETNPTDGRRLDHDDCLRWLLSCQHRTLHPFTGAEPGGWAWTDLSGGVPDADDTPGAILALANAYRNGLARNRANTTGGEENGNSILEDIRVATAAGVEWLLNLQNRDGGWPTFCRGWGKLPFDRSGADLTAHAMRALAAWRAVILPDLSASKTAPNRTNYRILERRITISLDRGLGFLLSSQQPSGHWIPLWFGNQFHPNEENPVYGTSRTLLAFRDLSRLEMPAARRGIDALLALQNVDGGWGATAADDWSNSAISSVEETALAVEALASCGVPESDSRLAAGVSWLTRAVETDQHRVASPIGFYFAKLWYYERLYPLIYTVAGLAQVAKKATR